MIKWIYPFCLFAFAILAHLSRNSQFWGFNLLTTTILNNINFCNYCHHNSYERCIGLRGTCDTPSMLLKINDGGVVIWRVSGLRPLICLAQQDAGLYRTHVFALGWSEAKSWKTIYLFLCFHLKPRAHSSSTSWVFHFRYLMILRQLV